jgi:hypothetical protein
MQDFLFASRFTLFTALQRAMCRVCFVYIISQRRIYSLITQQQMHCDDDYVQ